jgi:hypothetical protein
MHVPGSCRDPPANSQLVAAQSGRIYATSKVVPMAMPVIHSGTGS